MRDTNLIDWGLNGVADDFYHEINGGEEGDELGSPCELW